MSYKNYFRKHNSYIIDEKNIPQNGEMRVLGKNCTLWGIPREFPPDLFQF